MTGWLTRILAPGTTSDAPPTETEDWFTPRTDGIYQGGPGAHRYIRFSPTHRVWIADADHELVPDEPTRAASAPLAGSWTGAGRFSVSRPFQRPVVFTATRDTSDHTYRFRPDI